MTADRPTPNRPHVHRGPTAPRVIGVDLSLRSTGIAGGTWAEQINGPKLEDDATDEQKWLRVRGIRTALLDYLDSADLVVLEALSYGSNTPGNDERHYLWWQIRGRCLARHIPLLKVAPTQLKVYATGNGRASKEDVVQAVATHRPELTFRGNNMADAIVLAAIGLDLLGHRPAPLPETHLRVLKNLTLPTMALAS